MIRSGYLLPLLLLSNVALAQPAGDAVYSFLNLPTGAAQSASGGIHVASQRTEVDFLNSNPALLDTLHHKNLSLSYLNFLSDINHFNAVYASKFKDLGMVGVNFRYMDYGKFREADASGNVGGEFGVSDYAVSLVFSRRIDSLFSYGIGMEHLFSSYYQGHSYGVAFSGGLYYRSRNQSFSAGLAFHHLGFQMVALRKGNGERFPLRSTLGISKKVPKAPLRVSVQYDHLERWDLSAADAVASKFKTDPITGEQTRRKFTADNLMRHFIFGVEFVPSENFNLLLSYNVQRRKELALDDRPGLSGLAFGVSIKIKRFQLQYGIASYHRSGASNHITVTTNLSEWYGKRVKS